MDCPSWALSRKAPRDSSDRGRPQSCSKRCTRTSRTIQASCIISFTRMMIRSTHNWVSKRLGRMRGQPQRYLMLSTCRPTSSRDWATGTNRLRQNLRGWNVSEEDVKRAHESGAYRDFHNLNYLEYAYIQLGRYHDAQHTVDIIKAQYEALPDKTTAPDTPELQSRHVRGRTIYTVPDRVVYGYFDMLTRLVVESGKWDEVATIPFLVPS